LDYPNDAYDAFMQIYLKANHEAFPVKRISQKTNNVKLNPWTINGILQSVKTKAKLLRNKLNKPNPVCIESYKTYCKHFNKIKRKANFQYYRDMFVNISQTLYKRLGQS
jgi:hypothetical protein